MARITRSAFIKKGKWNTLETRWSNAKIHFYFRRPEGAKIRVKYGVGWFSKTRQNQTLDGIERKSISVGSWGLTRAKIQVKPLIDQNIDFEIVTEGP
ncbi:hypothetical protein [Pseudozobellia thermophila]|uniref:Uncharacterized protein n=1 Tax=Pseudozobellia thermophila TaxID=192903 RepID=A0A1M6JN35_9FLAO|nr:hypothetical protein [Pseudozobellia thermophila]SHJ48131.1 hypothetical protein SAMN04488513_10588 [Pseudozobellia thermophila]